MLLGWVFLSLISTDVCAISLKKVGVTQSALGMREVEEKRRKIQEIKEKSKRLERFLEENPIQFVRDADGKIWIVNHHHLAAALLMEEVTVAYGEEVGRFSKKMGRREFWNRMLMKGWAWPYSADGQAIDVAELDRLKGIESIIGIDDPYRSLASGVIDAGGIRKAGKNPIFYFEFYWANFFRNRIDVWYGEAQFKERVREARKLARSNEARDLPGYRGD